MPNRRIRAKTKIMSHLKRFSKMEHLSITSCINSDLTIGGIVIIDLLIEFEVLCVQRR